jgi:bacterioferritin
MKIPWVFPRRPNTRAPCQNAATHCQAVKDYFTRNVFEGLIKEEESRGDVLETQLFS